MADRPAAEVDVDVPLVTALLAEQMPDLLGRPLRVLTSGWDNVVLRLGDDLAVRVPRRASAAQLLANEQEHLAGIAARVPVDVPAPVRLGRPGLGFPWPWSVVPWFDGTEAGAVPRADRGALARPLAAFLAALHVPAAAAPHNPVRGVPLRTRAQALEDRLASGLVPRVGEVRAAWQDALDAPLWDGPPSWLHGDLHPFNIVVTASDDGVALRAVVDFGDMTAGDPATDLATAWLTFDALGRATFQTAVTQACGTDDATWRRARGWALVVATALLVHSDDAPAFADLGAQALSQVLDG